MTVTCPNPDVLRGVLDSSLPEPVQAELVAHLDGCPSCQATLEQIAAGGSAILEVARRSRDDARPEETSAFWPALRRVERDVQMPAADMTVTRAGLPAGKPAEPAFDFLEPSDDPAHLGRIDRFQIVELVGRGGMGVVFRAYDACLQRTVAIKLLDPVYGRNQLARSRFIREARAAAGVAHENVVTIHHVDCLEEQGLSFMVMQFVRGRSLQERLDSGGALPVREAVRIAGAVASGLAAAHEIGLIHRDIKPGNILLEQLAGRVLLTDFGLARLTEDVKLTQTGFVAGTPLYMSPEQARGEAVDHRSDLFSLGSVLYAMLTGQPPFPGSSAFTVLKQVTDRRPRPVQDLNPAVSNSLADVVDRLMEKDPRNRFAGAAEAAEALQAELTKLPPEPPRTVPVRRTSRSVPRYVRSWWRRNGAWVGGAVLALFVAAGIGEATKLTHWTILGQRGQAGAMATEADTPTRYTLPASDGSVWAVAFDRNTDLLATASETGTIKLWDAHDGHTHGVIDNRKSKAAVWALAFSPDGRRLFSAGDDGNVRQWDTGMLTEVGDPFQHPAPVPVRTISLSPDGTKLATGTRNGKVYIWDVQQHTILYALEHERGIVYAVAFSPDGQLVASAGSDQVVRIWSAANGSQLNELKGHTGTVLAVTFDPTSEWVASSGWDHTVRIWDVKTSEQRPVIDLHKEDVWSLAFCPRGKHLLAGGQDRLVRWIDIDARTAIKTYRGPTGPVYSVAVAPDGTMVAAGGRDGIVRVWNVER
jgi:WD40 repeat protein